MYCNKCSVSPYTALQCSLVRHIGFNIINHMKENLSNIIVFKTEKTK